MELLSIRIGVFLPKGCPLSMQIYFNNVSEILTKDHGYEFIPFNRSQQVPQDVDMYWDPRSGGGQAPYRKLYNTNKPIVVTIHGLSLFSLPIREQFYSKREVLKAWFKKRRFDIEWKVWSKRVSEIITVSEYSRKEIIKHFNIPPYKVKTIWNGFNQHDFYPLSSPPPPQ